MRRIGKVDGFVIRVEDPALPHLGRLQLAFLAIDGRLLGRLHLGLGFLLFLDGFLDGVEEGVVLRRHVGFDGLVAVPPDQSLQQDLHLRAESLCLPCKKATQPLR